MTVIKINAITVPEDAGDELARRFAARAGAVDDQEGFEGFELLRPTDDRRQWLVVTRWRDEESFTTWVSSPAFAHGHAGADRPSPHGGPVSVSSELWSYEVAGGSDGRGRPPTEPAASRVGGRRPDRSAGRDHGPLARSGGRTGGLHGGLGHRALVGDAQHQRDQDVIGQQRRPPVGDERERDSR